MACGQDSAEHGYDSKMTEGKRLHYSTKTDCMEHTGNSWWSITDYCQGDWNVGCSLKAIDVSVCKTGIPGYAFWRFR